MKIYNDDAGNSRYRLLPAWCKWVCDYFITFFVTLPDA